MAQEQDDKYKVMAKEQRVWLKNAKRGTESTEKGYSDTSPFKKDYRALTFESLNIPTFHHLIQPIIDHVKTSDCNNSIKQIISCIWIFTERE